MTQDPTPDPELATPDPELATPDPELATPDPELATPDPKLATPDPELAWVSMSPSVRARRQLYRLAAVLLRLVQPLVPIDWGGVKCVLLDGDKVLLVRHTYGSRAWDLPGGGRRRGEPAEAAARREMREELGIDGVQWRPLGELYARADHHRQTIQVYGTDVSDPVLTLDLAELAVARWFRLDGLPPDMSRFVLPILDGAGLRATAGLPTRPSR